MSEKKQSGIIYLDRTQLQFFNGQSQTLVPLPFPEDTIRDLDIVDLAKFDALIKNFIATNKIPPTSASLILSKNVLFIKDFVNSPHPQPPQPATALPPDAHPIDPLTEGQRYLESVPFEVVGSKSEPIANGIRVIAANKELYMDFKNIFEKYGVTIEYVTPVIYFEKFINIASGFTPEVAKTMLQRSDVSRQNSLLMSHQSLLVESNDAEKKDADSPEGQSKKRLYMMIGVFAVLILVMVGMFLRMNAINTAEKERVAKRAVVQPVTPQSSPTPVITEPVSSPSAALIDTAISIQIASTSDAGKKAATLKDNLKSLGFTKVVSDTSQTSVPQNTQIIVLNTVTELTKEKILGAVQELYPSASIKETTTSDSDVVITLGKK